MKACIITLGCKVNSYESEVIKERFTQNNYKIVQVDESPDVTVINTCSVTNQSDAKSRKLIRNAKMNNPKSIIVVCGCSSQNHQDDLLELGIDILLGNKDKTKIIDYVNEFIKEKTKITKFYNIKEMPFEDMKINNFEGRTRGFVKIQDGCNNYCSYCIIPYLRGNVRSKDLNTSYDEIKELVEKGYKEIVLTGIHTGSYGKEKDYNLVTLIRKISALDNLKRIRISSIEITEISDEFLSELKDNPKLCDHLHIPLQSGSDDILKDMNRKYNTNEFEHIINKIRAVRPQINITTDIIVGFPTESENHFNETYEFAKKIEFGKIHVFPYSKRKNTAAESLNNIVSDNEKKNRSKKLLELSNILEDNYYQKFINKKLKVLIEEVHDNYSIGHTSNYLKVTIDEKLESNNEYEVKIIIDGKYVKGIR